VSALRVPPLVMSDIEKITTGEEFVHTGVHMGWGYI
jgi:hypothetical protein